jgi:hypothetical protein
MTIAGGRVVLAFVSVNANIEGQFDVTISTDTMMFTKEDGLNVRSVP